MWLGPGGPRDMIGPQDAFAGAITMQAGPNGLATAPVSSLTSANYMGHARWKIARPRFSVACFNDITSVAEHVFASYMAGSAGYSLRKLYSTGRYRGAYVTLGANTYSNTVGEWDAGFQVRGMTVGAGGLTTYDSGVAVQSQAVTIADVTYNGAFDTLHVSDDGGRQYWMATWLRELSAAEFAGLRDDPWQLFAPRRLWLPTSAGGGNVYNEAITESLSSSDAIACAAAFARAASEAALATDSQSATGTLAAAASESASATDAPVSVLVASAAVSESGSAADAVSAGAASYDVTVTEAASAADAVSVIATRVAAVSEALSAADAYTVTATMGAAVSENGSAADAVNWGGASYSVDIAETGTLADAVSAALQALAAISEVADATDTPVAIISAGAAVLESAAAADLLAAARQITALLSEPATATDAVAFDADNVINAGIKESANATDGYVAVLIDGFLVVTASPRRVLTAGASRPANLAGAMRPHNLPGRGR